MGTDKGNEKSDKSKRLKKLDQMMFSKHWLITYRVMIVTLGTIAAFGIGGYYLDTLLNTKPFWLITGVVISYPIAQLILYKVFKKITK